MRRVLLTVGIVALAAALTTTAFAASRGASFTPLGLFDEPFPLTTVTDMTGDGQTIVGMHAFFSGGYIWTEATGKQTVGPVLSGMYVSRSGDLVASDYFDQMYAWAEDLVEKGLAYVDSLSQDEMREYRGTPYEPGRNSPDRNRPVAENLDLLRRMRAGEFEAGEYVLRAKGDMASPNIVMRDPPLYRIVHASHHRTGDDAGHGVCPAGDVSRSAAAAAMRATPSLSARAPSAVSS